MATSTSIARNSARWICGTTVEHLGDEVVEKAKTCLADMIGIAVHSCVSGKDFITAGVAGYQVMARLGHALITKEVASIFRPTGLVGAIGGAAAGARLLRLTEEETTSALALAANTASGLNEWPRE